MTGSRAIGVLRAVAGGTLRREGARGARRRNDAPMPDLTLLRNGGLNGHACDLVRLFTDPGCRMIAPDLPGRESAGAGRTRRGVVA